MIAWVASFPRSPESGACGCLARNEPADQDPRGLPLVEDAKLPSFAELHATDERFFRRDITGSHRDELPIDLAELFWSLPDNANAMHMLGYGDAHPPEH